MQCCCKFIPRAKQLTCSAVRVQSGWPWTYSQTTASSYLNRNKKSIYEVPSAWEGALGRLDAEMLLSEIESNVGSHRIRRDKNKLCHHLSVFPGCTLVKNLAILSKGNKSQTDPKSSLMAWFYLNHNAYVSCVTGLIVMEIMNCMVSGGLASCPQSLAWVPALEGKFSFQASWAFYECLWKLHCSFYWGLPHPDPLQYHLLI